MVERSARQKLGCGSFFLIGSFLVAAFGLLVKGGGDDEQPADWRSPQTNRSPLAAHGCVRPASPMIPIARIMVSTKTAREIGMDPPSLALSKGARCPLQCRVGAGRSARSQRSCPARSASRRRAHRGFLRRAGSRGRRRAYSRATHLPGERRPCYMPPVTGAVEAVRVAIVSEQRSR
jgi:hypothetical protein